jgi:hypothetical protein
MVFGRQRRGGFEPIKPTKNQQLTAKLWSILVTNGRVWASFGHNLGHSFRQRGQRSFCRPNH